MSNYSSLGQRINDMYEEYIKCPEKGTEDLCASLMEYLPGVIIPLISQSKLCNLVQSGEDILQIAMEEILTKGIYTYKAELGNFATYCGTIAKNVAISMIRRTAGQKILFLEEQLDYVTTQEEQAQGQNIYSRSPESILIESEEMEEFARLCVEWTQKYLNTYMQLDYDAHKMVGSAYSLILSKKFLKESKDLGSPKWAFESLCRQTVDAGGDAFLEEMLSWIPYLEIAWGDKFLEAKEEILFGKRIGDIVYGEHFTPKNFENWDTGIRVKIKKTMGKNEFEYGKRYFSLAHDFN